MIIFIKNFSKYIFIFKPIIEIFSLNIAQREWKPRWRLERETHTAQWWLIQSVRLYNCKSFRKSSVSGRTVKLKHCQRLYWPRHDCFIQFVHSVYSQQLWQQLHAVNSINIVISFDSCYKLSTALTAIPSCWQLLQEGAALTAVACVDRCHQHWQHLQSTDIFDSSYKLSISLAAALTTGANFNSPCQLWQPVPASTASASFDTCCQLWQLIQA